MLTKLTNGYKELKIVIAEYVQRAETELQGASGDQKKKWVKEQIDLAIRLPALWDNIVNVDGLLIGIIIDKICDTWNTVAGGDLTIGKPEDIAALMDVEAPKMVASMKAAPVVDVDARIAELMKQYGISAPAVSNNIVTTTVPKVETTVPKVVQNPTENWQKALTLVLGHEGGISNHANDNGGLTNLGITAGTLARANALGLVKETDVKQLTRDDAARIYHELYWKACGANNIQWYVCYLAFDACVNGGMGMFTRCFQDALNKTFGSNLAPDGKYGPKTQTEILKRFNVNLPMVNMPDMSRFGTNYLDARRKYYDRIIERNPSQSVFQKGWYNRLKNIAKQLGVVLPIGL